MGDQRRGPESRPGAGPGDDAAPEHSRGIPLDDAQPSTAWRPELESESERTDDADVRTPEESA